MLGFWLLFMLYKPPTTSSQRSSVSRVSGQSQMGDEEKVDTDETVSFSEKKKKKFGL